MPDPSVIGLIVVFFFAVALGFSNGFNDAANAVATAIGTRAISPRLAVGLAAVFNMAGAFTGLAVAKTIGKGILIPEVITIPTVIAGVAAVVLTGEDLTAQCSCDGSIGRAGRARGIVVVVTRSADQPERAVSVVIDGPELSWLIQVRKENDEDFVRGAIERVFACCDELAH